MIGEWKMRVNFKIDSLTRYVHILYDVPATVPDEAVIQCHVKDESDSDWKTACVWPYMSETAMSLISDKEWEKSVMQGRFIERRAGGLKRTVVWNPFIKYRGIFTGQFRISVMVDKDVIFTDIVEISINNTDVLIINNWGATLQQHAVSLDPEPGSKKWWINKNDIGKMTFGESTLAVKEKHVELPQLTYSLNLTGYYAIFVSTPPKLGKIEIRLSGDERTQEFSSMKPGTEILWRWTDMQRQHIVIKQPWSTVHQYEDEYRAHLDTIRLVPLKDSLVQSLNDKYYNGDKEKRKILVGYNEPVSWAFCENIQNNLQHYESLIAFAEAGVERVDIQIGRAGCKMWFETRKSDQLLLNEPGYADPVRGVVEISDNPSKMQQFTNMLAAQLKYSALLNMESHANMGATSCYVGSTSEADISKKHPEWRNGNYLKYDIPEVKEHILSIFEEAIEIGAGALSIDWCRYPYSVEDSETVTIFFRELRALADRYEGKNGERIEILTRFPARGVKKSEYMDYKTWIKEGLIDYMCPSNIQGRHMHFDIKEYTDAVKGTRTKLLPCVDGLLWGVAFPGMWLNRVIKCYEDGADGIYVYQCDALTPSPLGRKTLYMAAYPDLLYNWKEKEEYEQRYYSKNIYISSAMIGAENAETKYYSCERLRVWCEGFIPNMVEMYVDGELVNQYTTPPYILASEEHKDDFRFGPGKHILRIRAEDNNKWLEKNFEVEFEQVPINSASMG